MNNQKLLSKVGLVLFIFGITGIILCALIPDRFSHPIIWVVLTIVGSVGFATTDN